MPTASVTHSFSAGTSAKASEVNTNFSDLISTMNALDQVNLTTLTGTVTWAVTTSDLAASMSSSGDAGVLLISQTGVLASTKSAVKISDTAAQTTGDASLFLDVTNAATAKPALRIDDAGAAASGREAVLQVNSTTRGVQLPRMTTTQRSAITNALEGEEIYNTTLKRKEFYDGTYWRAANSGSCEWIPATSLSLRPDVVTCDGSVLADNDTNAFGRAILTEFPSGAGVVGTLPTQARHGIIGVGGTSLAGPANTVAAIGGAETHTLTAGETGVPTHGHADSLAAPAHTHTLFQQDASSDNTSLTTAAQRVAKIGTFSVGEADYDMSISTGGAERGITSGASATALTGSVTNHSGTAATAHDNVSPQIVMTLVFVL